MSSEASQSLRDYTLSTRSSKSNSNLLALDADTDHDSYPPEEEDELQLIHHCKKENTADDEENLVGLSEQRPKRSKKLEMGSSLCSTPFIVLALLFLILLVGGVFAG